MTRVLVVDDCVEDQKQIEGILSAHAGYVVQRALSAEEAFDQLENEPPDVVVLDPGLPGQDGAQLVKHIRERLPQTPTVIVSSNGNENVAIRALKSGAASYVPKNLLEDELYSTVRDVCQVSQQNRCHQRMLGGMKSLECQFELDSDRALLPALVGYLQEHMTRLGVCDEGDITRVGIALDEALVNALYHGNLELDSKLREQDGDVYQQLAVERSSQQPYCDRLLRVHVRITTELAEITIHDDGPGFDPKSLPDPTDPANLDKVSGRGVLLMRTFMDEVDFNDKGNRVTLRKRRTSQKIAS